MDINLAPEIEIKILDHRLETWGLPRFHSAMAAAVDLHACVDAPLELQAGAPAQLVPAGLAIHLADPNLVAVIVPRSGSGHRLGLVLGNTIGVVDADYQGPVFISVWNRNAVGSPSIVIQPGERVAQMMFVPVVRVAFRTVDEFSARSQRGEGGFGSTGSLASSAASSQA